MNATNLAADLVDRMPAMSSDCKANNTQLIANLIAPHMKSPTTQPEFIDCQQELLRLRISESDREARLRNWLLVVGLFALGGWITVGVILIMK